MRDGTPGERITPDPTKMAWLSGPNPAAGLSIRPAAPMAGDESRGDPEHPAGETVTVDRELLLEIEDALRPGNQAGYRDRVRLALGDILWP